MIDLNNLEARQVLLNRRFFVDKVKEGYIIYIEDEDGNISKLDWPMSTELPQAISNQRFIDEKVKEGYTIYLQNKERKLYRVLMTLWKELQE